jgi:hypothetical protein
MREDEYGSQIESALRTATEPLSAAEIREAVGCSRQRVYVWLQANEPLLEHVGKDRKGGTLYRLKQPSTKVIEQTGQHFDVQSFFVDHGNVVFVLVGPDGSTYHARPA